MGLKVYILLGYLLVYSPSLSVECASLEHHFRSQRDVELPSIHSTSAVDLSINGTSQHPDKHGKDLSAVNLNETVQASVDLLSDKNDIKIEDVYSSEAKNVKELPNNGASKSKTKNELPKNEDSKSIVKDTVSSPTDNQESSKVPLSENEPLEIGKEPEISENVKNSTKLQSGKETGRSLNIDIEKYISPDFHNKNNVYVFPTSPEIERYLDPDSRDFNDDVTEPELSRQTSGTTTGEFVAGLTTPQSDFFDSKFRLVADGIKQNLEDLDATKDEEVYKHKEDDEDGKYEVSKLIDNVKSKDNETEVTLHVVETKNVEKKTDEKVGKKSADTSIENGKNVDYKSTYLKTRTYDDRPENASVNNIPDSREDKTEQSIESTVKKVIVKEKPITETTEPVSEHTSTTSKTVSTKKPVRFSPQNITKETTKTEGVKSKSLRQFTPNTESTSVNPALELIYTKTSNENKIIVSKRGSTKYIDSLISKTTTPIAIKVTESDNTNFSIPPSATAWSLASLKVTPIANTTKEMKQVTKSSNVISVTVSPPMKEKSTSESTQEMQSDATSISPDKSTTDYPINTDILTTDVPQKTTPTLFWTTIQKAAKEIFNKSYTPQFRLGDITTLKASESDAELPTTKEVQKTTQKSENDIFKSSEEIPEARSVIEDNVTHSEMGGTTVVMSTIPYITTEKVVYSTTIFSIDNEDINSTESNIYSTTEPQTEIYETSTMDISTIMSTLFDESTTDIQTTDHQDKSTANGIKISVNIDVTEGLNINASIASFTERGLIEEDITDIIFNEQENQSTTEIITNAAPTKIPNTTESKTHQMSNTTDNVKQLIDNNITTENMTNSLDKSTTDTSKHFVENKTTTESIFFATKFDKNHSTTISLEPSEELEEIENNSEETGNDYQDIPIKKMEKNSTGSSKPTVEITPFETIGKTTIPVSTTEKPTTVTPLPKPTFQITLEPRSQPNRTDDNDTISSTVATTGTEMLSHDQESSENNPGMIAAIAISAVAGICLILLAGLLLIMRKRQKRVTYGQRCRPVSLDAYSLDNVSVYNSVRRKGGIRASKRSYGNPAFDDPVSISHQMNFQSLAKFNENIEDVGTEFEEIPQVTARANEVPLGCEIKNRYANVIPLPETRVFLKASDNDPQSDYINANYVTGPKNTRGYYIACQGPMQNTVDDFWRMIWEQQCRVVLMLTNLYENGVEKCSDYLPPSEVLDCHRLFGDFQITLKNRDVKEKYIISSLQLKNMVSNSWREITHLWYLGWPERGVPTEANSLIAFLIEARSHLKAASNNNSADDKTNETSNMHISGASGAEGGPVVVHCSPGTGRTGTVIACDIAIRDFELTRSVDIPKIVYRVRRDRASAVQTKDQYAFIYKVISLYATKLTGGALDSI